MTASEDIYVMIGLMGEVYPIQRDKFEQKYLPKDAPFYQEFDYAPSVVDTALSKNMSFCRMRDSACAGRVIHICKTARNSGKGFFQVELREVYVRRCGGLYLLFPGG